MVAVSRIILNQNFGDVELMFYKSWNEYFFFYKEKEIMYQKSVIEDN